MACDKRHPYLTREFWENNKFWKNEYHGKHEIYEEIHRDIMKSFKVKEDLIKTK